MSNYWTEYWRQGHITSFGDDVSGNYEGALANEWCSFFSSLEGNSLTLVDIGTGNGALIDIAVNQSHRDDISYIGVDYAALSISKHLRKDNIQFLEKTDAAALPLDDASVDVIVSQYGIEYSDVSKALAQCVRVLKPNGLLRFVMHYNKSTIVLPNQQILSALEQLRGTSGVLFYLRQLVNALAKYGKQSAQAESARVALNSSLNQVVKSNKAGLYGTGFSSFLKSVMSPSVTFKQQKSMIKLFEREMNGQQARLQDLTNAALSDDDIEQLQAQLVSLGVPISHCEKVYQDDKLIGVLISGVKVNGGV